MKSVLRNEVRVILDACALIAFLNDEPGADVVEDALANVATVEIAAINLLEVAYDAVRKTGRPEAASEVLRDVEDLPITIHRLVDDEMIRRAAYFKTHFRISLADSIALAFSEQSNSPLMTSDHGEFDPVQLAGSVRFIWIR
jgi:PIN domain nuclease of toxin-antitoxin system